MSSRLTGHNHHRNNMLELLVATHNKGKIIELKTLLEGRDIIVRSLADFDDIGDVEETGSTFAENAALKASQYALRTGMWTLADDSGLEVTALDNEPGVYSARYAGKDAGDRENISKLLNALNAKKNANRSAQFVCAICVANSKGRIRFTEEGVCKGRIALTPTGSNGFGYDPIFIPLGYDESFGELSERTKKAISHRSAAIEKIIEYLPEIGGS